MNLYEKLIEIRKCVSYLQKDTTGYKYTYVSGASVIGHIKEKMDQLEVLLFPQVTNREMKHYQTERADKKTGEILVNDNFVIQADMIWTWLDCKNPIDKIEIPFLLYGKQDDPSKAFGSGLTYSERYFLLKFFNIPTDDEDPDRFQERIETGKAIQAPKAPDQKKADFVRAIEMLIPKLGMFEFEKLVKEFEVPIYTKITDRKKQEEFYLELQKRIKEKSEDILY